MIEGLSIPVGEPSLGEWERYSEQSMESSDI